MLAEINVPRDAKTVEEAASLVEQARAQVVQADARIRMAEAQRDAAAAAAKVAESDLERLVARRKFAEKQYARINGLVAERATTSLVADEQLSDLDAATAAERTGSAEIQSAKAKVLGAQAAIEQAKADALEAKANLGVVQARLDRLKVNLVYAKIVAPFDGVVTHRTFHPGALIRSATEGGQPQPLLTVKRTDVMRVVVLVPDRDVALTRVGDSAVVSVERPRRSIVQRDPRANRAGRGRRTHDARRDRPAQPGRPSLRRDVRKGHHHPRTKCPEPGAADRLRGRAQRRAPAGSSSSSAMGSPGAPR